MARQEGPQEAVGRPALEETAWSGSAGLRFYCKLTDHVYAGISDADAVAVAEADPVPDRHAALHGLVSCAAPNAGSDALAGAEYLLAAVSTIRLLAERDAAGEDRAG